MPHLGIDGGQIEVELARIFRPERCRLEFDDDIAPQLQMVEKEIDKEFIAAHIQPVLTPDERKAGSQVPAGTG